MMNHVEFRRIREEKLGWTQERLARWFPVDEATIRRWEKGPNHGSYGRAIPPGVAKIMGWIRDGKLPQELLEEDVGSA